MNKEIQPKYGKCEVKCACGNVIETNSTKAEIKVDTCSACHPFYTGSKQTISTKGRAAKFMEKYGVKNA